MTVNELIAALSGLSDEMRARPVVFEEEGIPIPILRIVARTLTYDDEHVTHVVELAGWSPLPVRTTGSELYRHADRGG